MRKLTVFLFILVAGLTMSACDAISVDDGVLTIDLSISETTINDIITTAIERGSNTGEDVLFDAVTGVDLIEPDTIRVFGTGTDNGAPIAGSYDLQIGAEAGALKLAITAVDVPGVTLGDPRLVQANEELTRSFSNQVVAEGGEGVISSAGIQGGELQLRIAAPLGQ